MEGKHGEESENFETSVTMTYWETIHWEPGHFARNYQHV